MKAKIIGNWRTRLELNIFEIFVSLLGTFSAISYAFVDEAFSVTSIKIVFGNWAYTWLAGYALGGLSILYSFLFDKKRFEGFGLVIFLMALSINALAIFVIFGSRSVITLIPHIAAIAAFLIRIKQILRNEYPVLVKLEQNKK